MLYITSPWLICFIPGNLNLLFPFTSPTPRVCLEFFNYCWHSVSVRFEMMSHCLLLKDASVSFLLGHAWRLTLGADSLWFMKSQIHKVSVLTMICLCRILMCKVPMSMYSCSLCLSVSIKWAVIIIKGFSWTQYLNANRFFLQVSFSLTSMATLITGSGSLCHFVPSPESLSLCEPRAFWWLSVHRRSTSF